MKCKYCAQECEQDMTYTDPVPLSTETWQCHSCLGKNGIYSVRYQIAIEKLISTSVFWDDEKHTYAVRFFYDYWGRCAGIFVLERDGKTACKFSITSNIEQMSLESLTKRSPYWIMFS